MMTCVMGVVGLVLLLLPEELNKMIGYIHIFLYERKLKIMCGIVGFNGHKNGIPKIIKGLESLEYRGYDSASSFLCLLFYSL